MFVLKPLTRRPIALLWAGQVLAATGSEFYMVAVVWIAADLVGRDAGYVSAAQAGFLLAGSLFGGVLWDRWRHGGTMIAADLVRAGLVLILSLAGLVGAMSVPLLVAVAGCVAVATSAFDPALQATLPAIAPDAALRQATNGLFDATRRMARILGPSLIALVNSVLPKSQFFALTAITFLLSALAVRAVVRLQPREAAPQRAGGAASAIDAVLGGIKAVQGDRLVIFGLVSNLIGNFGFAMGVLLGMVLYLRDTSADPLTDYSLMMMAYGIGNLASNLVFASVAIRRPAAWLIATKLIFGLGVFLLPLAADNGSRMLAAAFAAINGPMENLTMLHLMQSRFPSYRLAQVYRLQLCAIFGGLLLAYLVSPSLFGSFGLAPMIMTAGAICFTNGLAGFALLRPRVLARAESA